MKASEAITASPYYTAAALDGANEVIAEPHGHDGRYDVCSYAPDGAETVLSENLTPEEIDREFSYLTWYPIREGGYWGEDTGNGIGLGAGFGFGSYPIYTAQHPTIEQLKTRRAECVRMALVTYRLSVTRHPKDTKSAEYWRGQCRYWTDQAYHAHGEYLRLYDEEHGTLRYWAR